VSANSLVFSGIPITASKKWGKYKNQDCWSDPETRGSPVSLTYVEVRKNGNRVLSPSLTKNWLSK
jgi:hypothetical protein